MNFKKHLLLDFKIFIILPLIDCFIAAVAKQKKQLLLLRGKNLDNITIAVIIL